MYPLLRRLLVATYDDQQQDLQRLTAAVQHYQKHSLYKGSPHL